MEEGYEDNFTDLLLMHPTQAYANPKDPQPSGSFDRTIEKCQKAIQLHSIKKRPKRNSKKMSDPKYRETEERGRGLFEQMRVPQTPTVTVAANR